MSIYVSELADRGVEVIVADLNDLASLKAAFKDSYGVFGVTDCECFFPTLSPSIKLRPSIQSGLPAWAKFNKARTWSMQQK